MSGGITIPGDYDDWIFFGNAAAPPTSPADLADINGSGIYGWRFANGESLFFPDCQIPHRYKEGTAIIPHIHWCSSTTETYTGTWTLEYVDWLSAATGTAIGTVNTVTVAISGSKTAYQMQSNDFSANISGTNRKISSILCAKLTLSLSAGTSCFLLGLDGHYLVDRHGSSAATTK